MPAIAVVPIQTNGATAAMAMRLSLLEPCLMNQLLDRPHLGCAMLIASCRERGIEATLIRAQTRYLRNMFVDDSDELWELIAALDEPEAQALGIAPYRKSMLRMGRDQLRSELAELYEYVYEERSPRHLLHGPRLEQMGASMSSSRGSMPSMQGVAAGRTSALSTATSPPSSRRVPTR